MIRAANEMKNQSSSNIDKKFNRDGSIPIFYGRVNRNHVTTN